MTGMENMLVWEFYGTQPVQFDKTAVYEKKLKKYTSSNWKIFVKKKNQNQQQKTPKQ